MNEILCWYWLLSLVAAILNSPIVIALLSLSFGGVVASMLASRYQRKQQIFDLRVQGLKTLLDAQANWLHTYLTAQERENHEAYMQLLTTLRYLKVLFPGSDVETSLKSYHDAAAELSKRFGTKIGSAALEAENEAIAKLHFALNDLTKVLVSRLGISEKN